MPKYTIPKNQGVFRVQTAMAGNYIVINNKTGKNQIIIQCRSKDHANDICNRLNRKDHNGEIWV